MVDLQKVVEKWSIDKGRDVMLPWMGSVTCGEAAGAIATLTRENTDLRNKLSEAERLLAEARAELKQCANNLLAAESQARRDYQALLDAHYHDERDLAAVIEAISQSRLSAKETGRG